MCRRFLVLFSASWRRISRSVYVTQSGKNGIGRSCILLFVGSQHGFFTAVVLWNICAHSLGLNHSIRSFFVFELTNFILHRNVCESTGFFESGWMKRRKELTNVELTNVYRTCTYHLFMGFFLHPNSLQKSLLPAAQEGLPQLTGKE